MTSEPRAGPLGAGVTEIPAARAFPADGLRFVDQHSGTTKHAREMTTVGCFAELREGSRLIVERQRRPRARLTRGRAVHLAIIPNLREATSIHHSRLP